MVMHSKVTVLGISQTDIKTQQTMINKINFTDAELMMIDQALSEYQDHIESDEESDIYESIMSKMLSLLALYC